MENIQQLIISGLLHSEQFAQKVLPHIKPEYFEDRSAQILFKLYKRFRETYGTIPTATALTIDLKNTKLSQTEFDGVNALVGVVDGEVAKLKVQDTSVDWMVDATEKYCVDRSVYNGIMQSISIIDGSDKKLTKDAIPGILQEALNVHFNTDVGHNYLEGFDQRMAYYHKKDTKIPLPLQPMNVLTRGGWQVKALQLLVGPTGSGKTHVMTFHSAFWLQQGYDVLYVTLEMAEEMIAKRIDCALLDCTFDQLDQYPVDTFKGRLEAVKQKTTGRLYIKEFPTSSVNVNHIRALLDELEQKQKFKPTILVLDYINLLLSTRVKGGENSYALVKSIAEEVRSLAVERKIMVVSASQTNRGSFGASDFDLTEVSESYGLGSTVDSMWGLICPEDLEKLGQMRIKVLKNRYGPKTPASFICGIDREKMNMFDIDTLQTPFGMKQPSVTEMLNNEDTPPSINVEAKSGMSLADKLSKLRC